MNKKIIMILSNGFDPDPRVYKEAMHLIDRGFTVEILCWDKDISLAYPETENIDGIRVVRFKLSAVPGSGWKQLPAFLRYIAACKEYLRKNKADYLHCNDIDGAITGYLARCSKTPMVFDMHEFYEKGNEYSRWIWRKLTIFLIRKSIAAICVNNAYRNTDYASIQDRLFLLRNYPSSDMLLPFTRSVSDVFRIGYHGAVRSQIPEFTALFEAAKDMTDVRVDINGSGPDSPKLVDLAAHYENVYFHGPYNGTKEINGLYAKTDILFCGYDPSNPNYQGDTEVVKYYEAIVTGTPMIMTAGIGMAQKVETNGFGVVCNTRNPSEIRDAILKLKNDKVFWQQCSNNEKAQAQNYEWKEAVKVLDRIYE